MFRFFPANARTSFHVQGVRDCLREPRKPAAEVERVRPAAEQSQHDVVAVPRRRRQSATRLRGEIEARLGCLSMDFEILDQFAVDLEHQRRDFCRRRRSFFRGLFATERHPGSGKHNEIDQRKKQVLVCWNRAGTYGALRTVGTGEKPYRTLLPEMATGALPVRDRALMLLKRPGPLPPHARPVRLRLPGDLFGRRHQWRTAGFTGERQYWER